MATFDQLITRIDVATQKLEGDVNDITGFATNLETAVTDSTTQADRSKTEADRAKAIADSIQFPALPAKDGVQYVIKDQEWSALAATSDSVKKVNGKTPDSLGAVTLTYTDVGALASTYVPTWASITGKPSVFPADYTQLANKPTTFTPSAHTHDAADIVSGVLPVLRIPNIPGNKITNASGPLALDLIPVLTVAKLPNGTTATADQFLAGDGTWKAAGGGGSSGGFAFTETGLTISGVAITAWPNANPNKPADLTNWGHTSGITQGKFFGSSADIAKLPDGDYLPGADSIATGQAIKGQLGFIRVRSIAADGSNKRAWFYPQPLGSDNKAIFYVYSNGKVNWIASGLANTAPA